MTRIKDTPRVDRPREKFLKKGPDALSKSDLLAIILGSGIKGKNVQKLAQQIIKKFSHKFLEVTIEDLKTINGIGFAKALQIVSAISLVKRFSKEHKANEIIIKNSKDVLNLTYELKGKKKEYLICLYLNARNVLVKKETISIGLLDKSLIHPREIFHPAVELNSASIILIHNHPSGDVTPSDKDKEVVKKIAQVGDLMGIPVLDFIITSENGSYSFFEKLKNRKKNLDYVADGMQMGLFDCLTIERPFYEINIQKIDKVYFQPTQIKNNLTFIDLFAGIGGFHIAFQNAGGDCVFASEWDENARKTYEFNHKKTSPELFKKGNFVGDITRIKPQEIPDFDILCAGFPCQPFSQAGFKKGFNEARGTLFFDIVKIIKEKKPKAFFLENVRGLLSHDNGKTFEIIKRILKEELGYSFFYKIIKASDFGLPQHRPRLFMVGFKDKSIDFEFPKPKKLEITMSDIWKGKCQKEVGYTLRVGGRGSRIDDRRNWDAYSVNGKIKRLGVEEGKKMQGLPENFVFPVTENQAMKQLGNSVAVPAIQAVAEKIFYYLKKKDYESK